MPIKWNEVGKTDGVCGEPAAQKRLYADYGRSRADGLRRHDMTKTFSGEYHHSLDAKGRLIVPSKFREILGSHFWIGRGFDRCLQIYDDEDWEAFSNRLKALPANSEKARSLVRYFMSGTVEMEIDRQGRILLPAQLRQMAGIDRNVVFVGMGTRGELWSEEAYTSYDLSHTAEDISAISEELLGSGFMI